MIFFCKLYSWLFFRIGDLFFWQISNFNVKIYFKRITCLLCSHLGSHNLVFFLSFESQVWSTKWNGRTNSWSVWCCCSSGKIYLYIIVYSIYYNISIGTLSLFRSKCLKMPHSESFPSCHVSRKGNFSVDYKYEFWNQVYVLQRN